MKRKVTALLTALLLTLTLCVPALAWTEYGAIYDETDALGSDELSDLGQYTLPQLTEALHLDLRVDIFTNEDVSEGTTAGDIATYVYKDSGYGWGEEKDGISLTLVMEPLADGSYTLAETDWCVYAMLSETRGDGQELSGLVYDAVEPYMAARAWDGTDMTVSADALCQAINAMAATAADYLSADFPTEAQQPETVQSGEASKLGDTGMNYVFDLRGMLSDGEREQLEDRAEDIALRRSCGIYTLFVEDFTAYGYGDDPYTALYQIYHAEGLGVGEDRNGVDPGAPCDDRRELKGHAAREERDAERGCVGRGLVEGGEGAALRRLDEQKDFAHDVALREQHRCGHEEDEHVPGAHHELHIVDHFHFVCLRKKKLE